MNWTTFRVFSPFASTRFPKNICAFAGIKSEPSAATAADFKSDAKTEATPDHNNKQSTEAFDGK